MTKKQLELGLKILTQKPTELSNPVLNKLRKELEDKLNKLKLTSN